MPDRKGAMEGLGEQEARHHGEQDPMVCLLRWEVVEEAEVAMPMMGQGEMADRDGF